MDQTKTSNRPYSPHIKVQSATHSLKLEPTPIDVVPVNPDTADEWEYPPYSGHYDGALFLERDDVMLTAYPRREDLGVWQL